MSLLKNSSYIRIDYISFLLKEVERINPKWNLCEDDYVLDQVRDEKETISHDNLNAFSTPSSSSSSSSSSKSTCHDKERDFQVKKELSDFDLLLKEGEYLDRIFDELEEPEELKQSSKNKTFLDTELDQIEHDIQRMDNEIESSTSECHTPFTKNNSPSSSFMNTLSSPSSPTKHVYSTSLSDGHSSSSHKHAPIQLSRKKEPVKGEDKAKEIMINIVLEESSKGARYTSYKPCKDAPRRYTKNAKVGNHSTYSYTGSYNNSLEFERGYDKRSRIPLEHKRGEYYNRSPNYDNGTYVDRYEQSHTSKKRTREYSENSEESTFRVDKKRYV